MIGLGNILGGNQMHTEFSSSVAQTFSFPSAVLPGHGIKNKKQGLLEAASSFGSVKRSSLSLVGDT